MIKSFLFCLATTLTTGAQAVNVCTDAAGKTSFQDQPCVALAPSGRNGPLPATVVTPRVAADTVKRYFASVNARDATTAASFLAASFTAATETPAGRRSDFDRPSFGQRLHEVLTASSRYEAAAACAPPVAVEGGMEVTCEVQAQARLIERASGGASTEVHTVVIDRGHARFARIRSRAHE